MTRMSGLAADAVLSFSTFPLKVSLALGAAMSAAGFAYALFTAVQDGINSRLPSGWATLVMLITLFAGAQLLCIGLVGAYVGAITRKSRSVLTTSSTKSFMLRPSPSRKPARRNQGGASSTDYRARTRCGSQC